MSVMPVLFFVYVQAGSSSGDILKSMSQELVPAGPAALNRQDQVVLDGCVTPSALSESPSVSVVE